MLDYDNDGDKGLIILQSKMEFLKWSEQTENGFEPRKIYRTLQP